ncbi:MAG TPA: DMT family transporter [Chthoniobacterales bacterium]|jgi:drug/metabolite transporter (DMT)-like permease|nr:DMT family transporter [Chthoniobacterales bacterium]
MKPAQIFILTLVAMIAFAGNSLLCRLALKQTSIDAASFTFIRIFSGATALWLIIRIRRRLMDDRTASPLVERSPNSSPPVTRHSSPLQAGNWPSALALFAYAAAFSFAYNSLSAGTGALLLFGAVQATMIVWGLRKGERLHAIQIVGLVVALSGLVVLLFPGLSAPPLSQSILMLGAGVAWGVYSLRGKGERNPASATAGNFLRAVPFAAVVSLISLPSVSLDRAGMGYAVLSGAIASGLGYVIWYTALSGLRATTAATVQLSVPVLAATGGILLLGELITFRYFVASIAVLGGIALVALEKSRAL